MSPTEFIRSGEQAQAEYEKTINKIEASYEAACEAAERAYHRRLDALRTRRDAARQSAVDALYAAETRDWDALHAAGHSYEEVKTLRKDAAFEAMFATGAA